MLRSASRVAPHEDDRHRGWWAFSASMTKAAHQSPRCCESPASRLSGQLSQPSRRPHDTADDMHLLGHALIGLVFGVHRPELNERFASLLDDIATNQVASQSFRMSTKIALPKIS